MAKKLGIIPIQGTLGNITFYKTRDGFMARGRGSLTGDRIANDAAFVRTRENGAEFGRAGKAGKVLRNGFRSLLQNTSDGRAVSRLLKKMMEVVHADTTNPRGLRNVIDGEAELLEGFEFNVNSKLGTTLYAAYTATVNRVAGELSVSIPSFIPSSMIAAPAGSTHYKITSGGAEIDFENETIVAEIKSTADLPWNGIATAAINLVNNVTPNSTKPLFIALGIEFCQDVNGTKYPLMNGAFNSLALVKVSGL